MANGVVKLKPRVPTHYNPKKGLAKIAKAEGDAKRFEKARDVTGVIEATKTKLLEQRQFILWWDGLKKHKGAAVKRRVADDTALKASDLGLGSSDEARGILKRWRKAVGGDEDHWRATLLEVAKRIDRMYGDHASKGTERGTGGTGEFERYTPADYVEAAREVLGAIDLDPASCPVAQATVKATQFFTIDTDGLNREWRGRVFLNPPYHRELQPLFIDKLCNEIIAERVTAAILLTNNSTDTDWFTKAQAMCNAICFTHGRVAFVDDNGKEVAPTQGQSFFYFGKDVAAFRQVFRRFGFGMVREWEWETAP
jgi:hypothetical protein